VDALKLRVEALASARITGRPVSDETARWLAVAGDWITSKLVNAGLIDDPNERDPKLADFVDRYLKGRTDVAPSTAESHAKARDYLVEFLPERRLSELTALDGEQWRSWLSSKGLSENYVRAITKNVKLFLNAAVKANLLQRNPFTALKSTVMPRPERFRFITQDETRRLLDACPSADWRALIALCRLAGLRHPSETSLVRWSDINWGHEVLFVTSPKTAKAGKASRRIPLFPSLRNILWDAHEAAPEGSEYVIGRLRGRDSGTRVAFRRIILLAGLQPWEKQFQNLRASLESELSAEFSLASVVAWLGNSPRIAMRHYLHPLEKDFLRASSWRGDAQSDAAPARKGGQPMDVGLERASENP
jgi:integrase